MGCVMRWVLLGLALAACAAQANEIGNYGVLPQATLWVGDPHAPTPLTVPGAKTVTTPELRKRLREEPPPILIDVLGSDGHRTLPGAVWLPGAGRGESFEDEVQSRLARALADLTAGDPTRTLVFYCQSPLCWLSYNAALRALRLGYADVLWYRGGIQYWGASGGALEPPKIRWKYPR
jgi:PQQ-dependent catabolism-associated CXXCW motif protein